MAADCAVPFSQARKIIAERLSRSKREIPHFYLFQDVDMEEALARRQAHNRSQRRKVSITDPVVQAAVQALRESQRINSHMEQEHIVIKSRVNVGLVTSAEDGLMVPVIADAARLDLLALSAEVKRRVEEARNGRLNLDVKGTFTITSLGMYGTQFFLPIINPPEWAIPDVGAVAPRVSAVGSMIGVRREMTLALACDHRGINGAEAAVLLSSVRRHLESDCRAG